MGPADEKDRSVTVKQIADEFRVNPETVRRWIRSNELPATYVGDGYRVWESDLHRFRESRSGPPPAFDAYAKARSRQPVYVYAFFDKETDLTKIGLTNDVEVRVTALAGGKEQRSRIDVLMSIHCSTRWKGLEIEAILHRRWLQKHHHWEWFALEPSDREAMASLSTTRDVVQFCADDDYR